jgi:hypothetical protein
MVGYSCDNGNRIRLDYETSTANILMYWIPETGQVNAGDTCYNVHVKPVFQYGLIV